ncbi:Na+/H+ antiporter subunit E [Pseudidiomarina terrestris]|uniref:Na+/H+ antiporter subunit E n=1 Tax=Pseudidiomarina terrestris TaxID=2820060 RepID=A0AAW7R106_9GAMM|nr:MULTISPECIES: Na+/H+ antiporter subunit E [unclassified Pseudidiomarina]MDN7125714.1 Na+/H+ antiporter subunit E [Pseudidiomarina sp. 1APP75-32.1]MDN7128158.1 Na+/H+ antiporter subunit E [Pseudidiomarina sp. 1APR75-33.1]MDN7130644.1 Na+/H+ antiporter subunit E [Pseudidiomarina sp. 1APR75-15]MDN7136559.1 Na+/H+ antiporter subunit E [Pseudidiomarina sp. 1ASP75-5]MDN7138927.1 Na+/H+ antiporter subunit E [Pseudidiomarina sp. 1ASP75-14]
MSKLIPAPWWSLFLLLFWLLLQNTVSFGVTLLGLILAVIIPLYTMRAREYPTTLHRPLLAVQYFLILLVDIILSNFNIAAIILMPKKRIQPALIEFPLDVTGSVPITILASTISLTPGTISAELARDGRSLLIHALNVQDADATVQQIKQRYERRLKEIFQC